MSLLTEVFTTTFKGALYYILKKGLIMLLRTSHFVKFYILLKIITLANCMAEEQKSASDLILPSHVYVAVSKVRGELDLIRTFMGKSEDQYHGLVVIGAEPREVFYQAMTFFDKADQLAFEQIRTRSVRPVVLTENIMPANVLDVINEALVRIRQVKAKLGINFVVKEIAVDPSKTPSDVYFAIMNANHQINLLLDKQLAPKDVFMQVSLAVGYSASLLANFPEVSPLSSAEALETAKRPVDVFKRLLKCYESLQVVGEQSSVAMLKLNKQNVKEKMIPSDVYDIASLLISELSFLHAKLSKVNHNINQPRPVFDPGRKFPSDVYQRISILESQLKLLETESKKSPSWLFKKHQAENL